MKKGPGEFPAQYFLFLFALGLVLFLAGLDPKEEVYNISVIHTQSAKAQGQSGIFSHIHTKPPLTVLAAS